MLEVTKIQFQAEAPQGSFLYNSHKVGSASQMTARGLET